MVRIAGLVLFVACSTNASRVESLGGKPPIASITDVGDGSDESSFSTCRDAAGVIFICTKRNDIKCVRVQRLNVRWSAGLPEAHP